MTKRPSALFLILVVLSTAAAGQIFADSDTDEKQIEHILDLFEKAYLEEDMDLLASLLSDQGYLMVMKRPADPSTALILDKAQIVQAIARRLEQVDYLEHRHIDRRISIDGPAATSLSTIVDRMDTGHTQRSRVYHIYVREEGGWKIVFSSDLLTD
jgi:hypothetical protein